MITIGAIFTVFVINNECCTTHDNCRSSNHNQRIGFISINQTVKLNPWVTATNCEIIAETETKLTIIGLNYYSKLPTFSCARPTPKWFTQDW